MLITQKLSEQREWFLNEYNKINPIDIKFSNYIINKIIKNIQPRTPDYMIELENKFYDSQLTDIVDYSVYDDDYYFIDLWCCWQVYSRKYLNYFIKKGNIIDYPEVYLKDYFKVNTILDLGCGIGMTSSALKQIYPDVTIYSTNIKESKQWNFCSMMAKTYNFELVSEISTIDKQVDLVIASEYFEHIQNPTEHLLEILNKFSPKYMLIANSFNTNAIGHFNNYKYQDSIVNKKDISKLFNRTLVDNNYTKLKTKFWNGRPTIWIKGE